ncbi:beta-tubulin 2 [Mycena floridula]|nr:beta-tubulin 2 [Mycena floridula]
MSREIINVQVGQAGNQVGEAFWTMLLKEHGIDNSGKYVGNDPMQVARMGVYFTEAGSGGEVKYVPRSVQVDLEPGVAQRIKSGPLGSLFRPDTFIYGEAGAGNNWAKGFYTEGAEMIESVLDTVRRQAEACDILQGFQLMHSLGGGTGSGMGTLCLSKLREEYPDKMMATFSVVPSPKVSETVVENYNAMLATHQLIDNSDFSVMIDNEALYDISTNVIKQKSPTFKDLNALVAKVMCGVSASLRFPGQLNGDLRKLCVNLVPFPRLHFLMPSYSPLYDPKSTGFNRAGVPEMLSSLFDRRNLLVACHPEHGRYLTCAVVFMGNVPSQDAEMAVRDLQEKRKSQFVEWIPDNISVSLISRAPIGLNKAAVALGNSTAIQEMFKRTLDGFSAMFKRGAFLHWYTGEGMDPMEFTEAENNARDLIAEYQQYQEATLEQEEEDYEVEAEE